MSAEEGESVPLHAGCLIELAATEVQHSEPAPSARVGVRLRSVRALSFGLAPATPSSTVGAAPQQLSSSPAESRKKKRSKLEVAVQQISELKEKLAQRAPGKRAAEPASACPNCQVLTDSAAHSEALHRRQHTYLKKQLDVRNETMEEQTIQHARALQELQAKHSKEIAAWQTKHDKKVAALDCKLDHAKLERIRLEKDSKELATTTSIASREAAKALSNERKLNEQLLSTSTADKIKIAELNTMIAELEVKVKTLEVTLDEVDRECEMSESEDEGQLRAESDDEISATAKKVRCCRAS